MSLTCGRYTRVTAPARRRKRPAIQDDLDARKARKLLRDTYRQLEHKGGWGAVARKFGLLTSSGAPARTLAYLMAKGQRPICNPLRVRVLMNGKRAFRKFLKHVAIPFLLSRYVSPTGCYAVRRRR